ncbi:MAG: ABC transporter permease [Candidatus Angelobacter sp. Gp1-AA117]|nr:MAG: ABC transporter permease [Candidatus Angelobacter sp. Gp1-AA117]
METTIKKQIEIIELDKPVPERLLPVRLAAQNGRWSGYWHLLKARLTELRREPGVVFWIFGFPLLMAVALGMAFRNKPPDVSRVAVIASPEAERIVALLNSAPHPELVRADVLSEIDAHHRFQFGKYDLVVRVKDSDTLVYEYDPTRPESVLAHVVVDDQLEIATGRKDRLQSSTRTSTEPGSRYIDFLIPGILGMNLMISGLWSAGFVVVDMRQRKILKRYVATPMRRSDFLLAISTSRLLLMVLEVLLLLGCGILVFHFHIVGSWASILLVSMAGAFTFAGMGLLAASRTQKSETANGIINIVMIPMWMLSGVFFSYEHFPGAIQPLIKLLPLTALNDALRSIILEGAPLRVQVPRLLVLCLWGGISFIFALRWFRWT